MFEHPVDTLADKTYSIVSNYKRGNPAPRGQCGKTMVEVEGADIKVYFLTCNGSSNGTSVTIGQFPELYFEY